ncbi:ABC transporter ATP-binding protein [Microbacterium sp. CJ77]|uniref:ABC transporter ATP-binding protein n=1 Tax=Microbacterium sp. CJ77 TaxID=2079201 RepID=UPI000CD95603|nr:ATP-binding cassette domain-containing protein [Microbacterium sp. CJ77]
MIEVKTLAAGYDGVPVVPRLEMAVAAGEVVAFLGRNGMGKTTVMRTLAGHLPSIDGEVVLNGLPLRSGRADLAARAGLSFLPDDRGVFPRLTVAENLALARRRGYEPPVDVTALFPVIRERMNVNAGDLSGGQKQQVGLARAILAGEKAIFVDEFSQGLQPSLVRDVLAAFREIAGAGVVIVLVDQSPQPLVEFATRVMAMEKGAIVLDSPAAVVRDEPQRLLDFLVV